MNALFKHKHQFVSKAEEKNVHCEPWFGQLAIDIRDASYTFDPNTYPPPIFNAEDYGWPKSWTPEEHNLSGITGYGYIDKPKGQSRCLFKATKSEIKLGLDRKMFDILMEGDHLYLSYKTRCDRMGIPQHELKAYHRLCRCGGIEKQTISSVFQLIKCSMCDLEVHRTGCSVGTLYKDCYVVNNMDKKYDGKSAPKSGEPNIGGLFDTLMNRNRFIINVHHIKWMIYVVMEQSVIC